MNDVINTIRQLKDTFDLNNIEDYKTLLMLTKNLFFEKECMERYEIYRLIEEVTSAFSKPSKVVFDEIELYNYFIPKRISKED